MTHFCVWKWIWSATWFYAWIIQISLLFTCVTWRDLFLCATWRMSRWISSATWFYVWHIDDSGWRYWLPTRETGINSMCDATHFYVYKWMWSGTWFCRIMILRVTWLSHVSDMTDHPRMKRDPFLYEARLISMCAGGCRARHELERWVKDDVVNTDNLKAYF